LVDLSHVAAEAAHALRARFPSRSVVLRAPDAANVIVDPDDAYEAIRNLLENALQYAPHSTVELAVAHDGGRACVTVSDNGPGVGDAEREKIFERFYRGSAREDVEGSGLGLAIVARVAARWNGTVALQSQPGRTVFTLAFPLAEQIDA
jgi:signal transduction histidine kinase